MSALSRLSPRERHKLIDQQLFISSCERILEQSGLVGWKSRRYTLVARYSNPDSHEPESAIIYMTEFGQYRNQVQLNTYSDCYDIPHHDCPIRIIEAADQYPVLNDCAQQWRDQVRDAHSHHTGVLKILRELARYHPRIDDRIVVWPHQTVHYIPASEGHKRQHHYFNADPSMTRKLTPNMVNLSATQRVRNGPADRA